MSTPKVELVNQALRLIGAEAITSFDEQNDLAATCTSLFDDTVRSLQASYPWRFTLEKQQLSRLTDPPINEWTYQHALMPGQLVLRQLFPSAQVGAKPVADYEVFGNRVYSDQPVLWADYQTERDPATWPPHFRNLARHALAAVLAIPVAESAERADYFNRLAFGSPAEGSTGGLMGVARRLDAQQQPPQRVEDFPLLTARHGGGI
jgi:hypothetical protein